LFSRLIFYKSMVKQIQVTCAIILNEDKVLCAQRSEIMPLPLKWEFPGGKIEKGESPAECLKREILEEVGIEIFEENHYVESKSFMTDNGEYVIDIVFLCKYKSGKARCMQEEEVSEIHWMSSEELLNNESAPFWLKDSIQKAYELRLKLEKKIG